MTDRDTVYVFLGKPDISFDNVTEIILDDILRTESQTGNFIQCLS